MVKKKMKRILYIFNTDLLKKRYQGNFGILLYAALPLDKTWNV